jgi:hypothetical protein
LICLCLGPFAADAAASAAAGAAAFYLACVVVVKTLWEEEAEDKLTFEGKERVRRGDTRDAASKHHEDS